jgi:hypothetical protein
MENRILIKWETPIKIKIHHGKSKLILKPFIGKYPNISNQRLQHFKIHSLLSISNISDSFYWNTFFIINIFNQILNILFDFF